MHKRHREVRASKYHSASATSREGHTPLSILAFCSNEYLIEFLQTRRGSLLGNKRWISRSASSVSLPEWMIWLTTACAVPVLMSVPVTVPVPACTLVLAS